MLFARALTNGARFYCPDIFGGAVYTPEELGEQRTETAPVVVEDPPPEQQSEPAPVQASEPPPLAEGPPAPADEAADEPSFFAASAAQLARLEQLLDFATSTPKCGKIAAAIKDVLDRNDDVDAPELSKGEAGALIAKAKVVLEPLGWCKEPPAVDEDGVVLDG
jgi:hypothetical protein